MKTLLPLAALSVSILALSLAACGDGGRGGDAATTSPGVKSTAYLPASPNNAGTGTHDANTSLAEIGGQLPDSSNPSPPGLPAASAALN